jgi:MFS family permease
VTGAIGAGVLVTWFGIGTALTVDVASFAVAVVFYRRFAGEPPPRARAQAGATSHVATARAIAHSRPVLALTLSFTVATAAAGILNATFSGFFDGHLGDAHAYGYAIAAIGAGYACGELLTGLMRRQTLARRSVGVAFLASAGLVWTLSFSTSTATAFLLLFLLGAADGTTEVVRDTLIQLNTASSIRAAVFAVSGSIQTAGMVGGLAVAPLLLSWTAASSVVRISAYAMAASAVIAAIGLVTRRVPDDALIEAARAVPSVEVVRRTLSDVGPAEPAGAGDAIAG